MVESTKQPSKAYSYLVMIGHICTDMNQSTIPALLPFLMLYRGIDYAAAAGLMFASSSLSSLIQPLLGMLADRKQMPQLMAIGILMTGLGVASIGFLENYWAIFAAVIFAGIGSAIFHPEGGRMANCVAGAKKGQSMSNFVVGGNLGFAIGPIVTAFAAITWGLRGTLIVMIPTLITVGVFLPMQKKFVYLSDAARTEVRQAMAISEQKDDWVAMSRLFVSIFSRSVVQAGLVTFIPLYWVSVLMQTQQQGSLMVTVIALSAAAAAYTGGRLADRFGFSRVIRFTFAAVAPLIILLPLTNSVLAATALVVPLAWMLALGHGPSVVLGQKYLPNRLGMATGVTLGLAVSVGGMSAPLLGRIGDNFGLVTVLYVLAGVGLFGFLGTLLLKEPAALPRPEVSGVAGR